MIVNLFSIFDPSGLVIIGWISIAIVLIALPISKFIGSSSINILFSFPLFNLKGEVDTPLGIGVYSRKSKALLSLFLFIALINVLGLLPYVFTPTSHIVLPLRIRVPLWLGLYVYR